MNAVTQPQQRDEVTIIRHQMNQMGDEFRRALPTHITTERFSRVAMTAINRNPDLLAANRKSLFEACMLAAQDGLLPDGREAALVVFGKQVAYMPMVAGIRKKVYQSGEITSLVARAAHANDEFEVIYGDDERIHHKPNLENPGPIIAVYAIATYRDGSKARDVMSLTEVNRIREMSRGKNSGPWRDHYEEMAKKTVIRRLAKSLPLSTEADEAIRRDDQFYAMEGAAGGNVRQLHSAPAAPRTIDARLSDFAVADEPDEDDFAADAPPPAAETPANPPAGAPASSDPPDDAGENSEAAPALSPIEEATQAGRYAARKGIGYEAVPPKYAKYKAWARAWQEGHAAEGERMEAEARQ